MITASGTTLRFRDSVHYLCRLEQAGALMEALNIDSSEAMRIVAITTIKRQPFWNGIVHQKRDQNANIKIPP